MFHFAFDFFLIMEFKLILIIKNFNKYFIIIV